MQSYSYAYINTIQVMLQIDELQGDDNIRQARKALVQAVNSQLDRSVCVLLCAVFISLTNSAVVEIVQLISAV